jgi:integrase
VLVVWFGLVVFLGGFMGIQLGDFTQAFRHDSKGAGATRAKALSTFRALQAHADRAGWGKVTPLNITPKQVHGYVDARIAAGLSARSVQNEVSHLRRCVEGAGRDIGNIKDDKSSWSSARLGVPSGTRIGNKPSMDMVKFADAREKLDQRMQSVVDLQLACGLRMQEAIKSTNTFAWSIELEKAVQQGRSAFLVVTDDSGSKGGRPRHIFVPFERVQSTLAAVTAVEDIKTKDGYVLDRDDLKSALKYYDNEMRRVGLTGNNSGHALRRTFTCRQYEYYLSIGSNEKQALSRLCSDLGHGDERGRWVENNYLASI